MTKRRWIGSLLLFLAGIYPCLFCAYNLHFLLMRTPRTELDPLVMIAGVKEQKNILLFFGIFLILLFAFIMYTLAQSYTLDYKAGMREIIPGIKTPLPCGDNLHGSARWLSKSQYNKAFYALKIRQQDPVIRWLADRGYDDLEDGYSESEMETHNEKVLPTGGVVVGQSKNGRTLYIVGEDTHSLTLGATRSSKTRSVVLPSICVTALAGESMVISDVKMELYLYTAPFLRRLGYEVVPLDFENPARSTRYNFMQPINDRLEMGDIVGAKTAVNELVETLVGKQNHGERIWEEGEKSIMACCIIAVAYDNRNNPRLQNLTNVYHFVANMCAPIEGKSTIPLQEYMKNCPEDHPAKSLAGISNVAHFRTRSSFYAAALASLRLFEDYNVADMTSATGFDIYATSKKKRAIFIILPDEKPVYYSVASLFVLQHYQMLVAEAKAHGGRLQRRVEFFLDEIGNFAHIPHFDKLLSVGAGRGIRYHLFLQSTRQLDETYNQNVSSIVRSNCETWVYLQSDDQNTVDEISKRMGNYTTKSPNLSAPLQGTRGGSASFNYMSRPLLTSEEVKKVVRPYQLVLTRHDPVILFAPDIGHTIFNRMLGLGDKDHNIRLSVIRHERRVERRIRAPQLWGIWKDYQPDPDESNQY